MNRYAFLRRALAALLLVCLLGAQLTALADDFYFGEQELQLWDGAYAITVDKHWTLETDFEIPNKRGPHDRFWTWKQFCVKDNHNQKVLRFFKEVYPANYGNPQANVALLETFAEQVAHLKFHESHAIKIGDWQAVQLVGKQYKAIAILTEREILYFASQQLTLEQLTAVMKTLREGEGDSNG